MLTLQGKMFLEESNKYAVELIEDYSDSFRLEKVVPSLTFQRLLIDIKGTDIDKDAVESRFRYSELNSLTEGDDIIRLIIDNENEWDRLLLTLQYSKLVLDQEYLPKVDLLLRTLSNRDTVQEKVWESNFKAGLE